jgi:hypothetical protein
MKVYFEVLDDCRRNFSDFLADVEKIIVDYEGPFLIYQLHGVKFF